MKKFYKLRTAPTGLEETRPFTISTQLVLNEAVEQGMEVLPVPDSDLICLRNQNNEERYFYDQVIAQNSSLLSHLVVNDKQLTKHFLRMAGLRVADSFLVNKEDLADELDIVFSKLQKPLVIKPLDGSHGNDVILNIETELDYKQTLKRLFAKHNRLLIEEQIEGTEYRLTATREKCLGIIERIPANVVGDGRQSIEELVKQKNQDPRRADSPNEASLVYLTFNQESDGLLHEQGLTRKSIPEKGRRVFLRRVSNLSQGGDSVDLTNQAHSSLKELAQRIMKAIPGLEFAGIDLICPDLKSDVFEQKYCVVEINNSPGFANTQLPAFGAGRKIAADFLKLLFENEVW